MTSITSAGTPLTPRINPSRVTGLITTSRDNIAEAINNRLIAGQVVRIAIGKNPQGGDLTITLNDPQIEDTEVEIILDPTANTMQLLNKTNIDRDLNVGAGSYLAEEDDIVGGHGFTRLTANARSTFPLEIISQINSVGSCTLFFNGINNKIRIGSSGQIKDQGPSASLSFRSGPSRAHQELVIDLSPYIRFKTTGASPVSGENPHRDPMVEALHNVST